MASHAIWSAAERCCGSRCVRIAILPVVRGKYADVREPLQIGGDEPVLVAKHQLAKTGDLHRREPAHEDLPLDRAEHVIERELHVFGRDRRAIVPAGIGMQSEMQRTPVGSKRHTLRQVSIEAAQLVARGVQEVIVGAVQARRGDHVFVPDVGEVADRGVGGEPQHAPLRRVGIHVVETPKIRRIFQFVDEGNAVTKVERCLRCGWGKCRRDSEQPADGRRVFQRPVRPAQRASVGANRSPMRM